MAEKPDKMYSGISRKKRSYLGFCLGVSAFWMCKKNPCFRNFFRKPFASVLWDRNVTESEHCLIHVVEGIK